MDLSDDSRNPYEILELQNGPSSTEQEIRKAYKLLALKKHPDKNKNNPNAAAEFGQLEKAYRILTDESARGALDDFLQAKKARAERDAERGDKRRKLREELEKREKKVAVERNEEEMACARLQSELERLRQKMQAEAAAAKARAGAAAAAASASAGAAASSQAGELDESSREQLRRTVKVRWDPSTQPYTADDLRRIFSLLGGVQDVVVKHPKSGREGHSSRHSKASALVVMSSMAEAHKAASSVCGDVGNPLLVVPLLKVAPELSDIMPGPAAPDGARGAASAATAATGVLGTLGAQPTAPLFPMSAAPSSMPMPMPAKPLFAVGAQAPQPFTSSFPGTAGSGASGSTFPLGVPSSFPAPPAPGSASAPFSSFPTSFPGAGMAAGRGMGGAGGAEGAILEKMRRAAERERQLAALAAEEKGDRL